MPPPVVGAIVGSGEVGAAVGWPPIPCGVGATVVTSVHTPHPEHTALARKPVVASVSLEQKSWLVPPSAYVEQSPNPESNTPPFRQAGGGVGVGGAVPPVVGATVGAFVGEGEVGVAVVGTAVGENDGTAVGSPARVGCTVGDVVGRAVGAALGAPDVGDTVVGDDVVGARVVGCEVGAIVGECEVCGT